MTARQLTTTWRLLREMQRECLPSSEMHWAVTVVLRGVERAMVAEHGPDAVADWYATE